VTETVYRFLPWARRGLASALPQAAAGTPTPARADVGIEVVVGGVGSIPTGTTLYGPGDVIGLDPTVIVRTTPRAGSTNVEPNYLAAVDFDQPELPWLFTPTGVPASGHLKPWLVLVVVEDRPGVSMTVPRGAPLPRLRIDSGAKDELPDLTDSWAWAHVQLLDSDAGASVATVGAALADRPGHNVSRLVCPRRLKPDAAWLACLVPAFDAGVVRGLGGNPQGTELNPAWIAPDQIELPVYYHWRFQTGPQGDFESLARRLKPAPANARVGLVTMDVGRSSPFVPAITGNRILDMDGALRAPDVVRKNAEPPVALASLDDVPTELRAGLQEITRLLADAADGTLDGSQPGDAAALGPPVYAGTHVSRTTVSDDDATWFQELNTDPRGRVAAGLGAEVLRTYQEDVVEACWQQVGDVIAIETALSRARLSLEVSLRFTARHLEPLPPGRFVQITAPLMDRVLLAGRTLPRAIAPTSFPDRATDAALRRYTAARGRVLTGVARRAERAAVAVAARSAGDTLVTSLAAGRADIDPTRFPVIAIDGLPDGRMPAPHEGKVALDRYGVAVQVDPSLAAKLTALSRELVTNPPGSAVEMMTVRPGLLSTGILGSAHIAAAREVALADVALGGAAATATVLDAVLATVHTRPAESGFLLETSGSVAVSPLHLGAGGRLLAFGDDSPPVVVATFDNRVRGNAREIGELVSRLPNNVVRRDAVTALGTGASPGELIVTGGARGATAEARREITTVTMPPLIRDAATIRRYEAAISAILAGTALGEDPAVPAIVAFALPQAVAATKKRADPLVVHPARLDTMVSIAGQGVSAILADPALAPGWRVPERFDRVMAYPRLDAPAYHYLAEYDRTRFCPGIDDVPPDSITLLESNPRFIAAFMAGLNHETNEELLWRGFPTDGRGTPWRRFWLRADGGPDIAEIHTWRKRGRRDDLTVQTSAPNGNLVLLIRGELLRRYPTTMVIAVKAETQSRPSARPEDVLLSVFSGSFDPDVSFFGFDLVSADLTSGAGWFFGLLEPVTEPRFGFDETVGRSTTAPTNWNDVAWPDLGVAAAGPLTVGHLAAVGLGAVGRADVVAAALFQRPFKLLVHARHLV
jgi:hypothetical protein